MRHYLKIVRVNPRLAAFACAVAALLLAGEALSYHCVVKVTQVQTGPDGSVTASFENATNGARMRYQGVCNVNSQSAEVSSAACRQILKTLQLAFVTRKDVHMYFVDPAPANACVHDDWTNLTTQGRRWYWGPVISD